MVGLRTRLSTVSGSSSISVVNRVLAPRLLSAGMRAQLKWSPGPGVKVLERLLKVWREVENIQPDEPPPETDVSEPVRDPDTGHMISSVVAAALCIKPRGLLTDRQARKVNALKQGSRAFAIMRGLAMRFNGILRSRSPDALDEWIDDAIDTELTATCVSPAFCAGILMPSKMQSNSRGATVKPKGRSTASRC